MEDNHLRQEGDGHLCGQEHEAMRAFMELVKAQRAVLSKAFNRTGVYRSQHQILMYIAENPNATQKEIARLYRASPATIAVSLKKLEKGGYIKRMTDKEDNRCKQLHITTKGQNVVEDSYRVFREVERRAFVGMSRTEIEQMIRYLCVIHRNMEELMQTDILAGEPEKEAL